MATLREIARRFEPFPKGATESIIQAAADCAVDEYVKGFNMPDGNNRPHIYHAITTVVSRRDAILEARA